MRADLPELIKRLERLYEASETTTDADTGDDATFLPVALPSFDQTILDAISALRALRDAPVKEVRALPGFGDGIVYCDYRLIGQRVRLVVVGEEG